MNPIPPNFFPPPPPRSDPPQRLPLAPEPERARKFEDLLSKSTGETVGKPKSTGETVDKPKSTGEIVDKPKPIGDASGKSAPAASTAHSVVGAVQGRHGNKDGDSTGKDSGEGDATELASEISDVRSLSDAAGSSEAISGVVKGRRGAGQDDDDDARDSEAVAMDLTVHFSKNGIVASTDAASDANTLVARITDLSALIAQTASSVTLDASGTATIQLSQDQLPGSQVVVKMDQTVILVTFLSNNASSLAALQARGGEVAQSLSQRMGQQIKVEVYGSGSDSTSGTDTLLGSWDVDPVGQDSSSGSEKRSDS